MKLLVHSYFPPRLHHMAGGAQQFSAELMSGLARRGFDITYLCPEIEAGDEAETSAGLKVVPGLIEPGAEALSPYERRWNGQLLVSYAEDADVVLSMDRALPASVDVPAVLCLNNFSYGDAVDAAFSFTWDEMVVPSPYVLRCVSAIFGEGDWGGEPRQLHCIPYGIDTDHFSRRDGSALAQALGIDPDRNVVLFPHRPDPLKGLRSALDVVEEARTVDRSIVLAVPLPPKSDVAGRARESKFIRDIQAEIGRRGLRDSIVFHDWIEREDLPSYYSIGSVCMNLSRLPESFGLTPVESIACGTPAVVTPAGAVRSLLPPKHGLSVVEFDDVRDTAAGVAGSHDPNEVVLGQRYIEQHYSIQKMVDSYADMLSEVRKSRSPYQPLRRGEFRESPWCRPVDGRRMWHDYMMRMVDRKEAKSEQELEKRGFVVRLGNEQAR